MALVVKDRVKQFSTTSGTGTLTLGATPSGFQAFSVVGDGNTTYYAIVDPNTGDWEVGLGTYTLSGTTLSRDTVLESSNSGSLVNFGADTKDVFVTYPAAVSVYETPAGIINQSEFPSGTKMLFQQTTAPTGWTKDTSHDNKALRVVSGTAGSGGSVAFTTAFASQAVSGSIANTTATGTVGNTTLTTAQIPSHTHTFGTSTASLTGAFGNVFTGQGGPSASGIVSASILANNTGGGGTTQQRWNFSINASHSHSGTTDGTGGGGSHTHSFTGDAHNHSFTGTAIDLAVQYVDIIIATKD
jgi:hypothetical protein